ncbi:MAG: YqaJ viral recombinase family protein [Deltaproteobacteria bacterium]|nr:YqaJ viral recombinase family protein [Deltaproteobacteria bacterium]
MEEIKVIQGSTEWFEVRTGLITGSHFKDIMPTAKQKQDAWSKGQLTYLRKVAAEILTGQREDTFKSSSMQWGNDWEGIARKHYEMHELAPVRECGFYQYSDFIGSSPDGIIGDNEATFEVKCPESKQHLRYLLDSGELLKDYYWQVYGEMLCTGIDKAVICSFDPRMPVGKNLVIVNVEAKNDELENLSVRLNLAVEMIKDMVR